MGNIKLFKRNGQVSIWLETLVGIFIVAFFYILGSYVLYDNIAPAIYPHLSNISADQMIAYNSTDIPVNTTQMSNTIQIIQNIWMLWPLIFIFGLLFRALAASARQGYEAGVY